MKKRQKFLWIMAFACLTTVFAKGQDFDKSLWGAWKLDSVELTTNRITQKYALSVLYANKSLLPRNMFTLISFNRDELYVNTTETEFVPSVDVCFKGTFTTKDGKIFITMRDNQTREFTYSVENETLKIRYEEGSVQFYLIFKLAHKYVES